MVLKQKSCRILVLVMGLMMINTWNEPVFADSPGLQLYEKACKKCHGKQGEGKKRKDSGQFKYPPIREMTEEDLLAAMIKYREMWQNKSYSKDEKRMAKTAGRLSDDEMKAVTTFIASKLNRKSQ